MGHLASHNFLTVTPSYLSKVIRISDFHAEKIPKAVFLCVFRIAFPAYLLCNSRPGHFEMPQHKKKTLAGSTTFTLWPIHMLVS